jgi:type IV secretion system protein VirB11
MNAGVYLAAYLAPLKPWMERPEVTDIWVNRPGEIWTEDSGGQIKREWVPELTDTALERLARQIAAASHQGVSREKPLLSASLPDGARVQIVGPPATRCGVALAVRKHTLSDMTLSDLGASGIFGAGEAGRRSQVDDTLDRLLREGQTEDFLRLAVQSRKTIVLSGGTSSGKTTLLNALIKEIDRHERLIVIEDAPEIRLVHDNALGPIAARGDSGEAQVDVEDLLQASLRMRPDRIMLGELRGREAFAFLRAINTGHPGSITTLHADSPTGAIDQIALLSLLSGIDVGWEAIRAYIRQIGDVILQLKRTNGERQIVDIEYHRRN